RHSRDFRAVPVLDPRGGHFERLRRFYGLVCPEGVTHIPDDSHQGGDDEGADDDQNDDMVGHNRPFYVGWLGQALRRSTPVGGPFCVQDHTVSEVGGGTSTRNANWVTNGGNRCYGVPRGNAPPSSLRVTSLMVLTGLLSLLRQSHRRKMAGREWV